MESQSQNPEFRINPENFHPCQIWEKIKIICTHLSNVLALARWIAKI